MTPLEKLYLELQERELALLDDYNKGVIVNPEYNTRTQELTLCIVRVQQLLLMSGEKVIALRGKTEPTPYQYESHHGTHVGKCECCNSPVYDSLCDEDFIKANPNLPAGNWDYWLYCTNPECKHHYGVGYDILNNDNRRFESGITTDIYPSWVE